MAMFNSYVNVYQRVVDDYSQQLMVLLLVNSKFFLLFPKGYTSLNPIQPPLSYRFPMVFLSFSYGFPIVFLWFSYGFPMVFLWFSYGFLNLDLPGKAPTVVRIPTELGSCKGHTGNPRAIFLSHVYCAISKE